MNNPLVSIIIPIYNVEQYLPQCIDSVLQQTYTNLEVLLINDGSPDNSDTICREYAEKDSRIKYYKRTNHGLSATRNFGIQESTGDYYFFLDSDDYIDHDCIDEMVHASADGSLAITNYQIDFSDEGRIIPAPQPCRTYASVKAFLQDFNLYFATKTNFVWGKLYKATTIRDNGLSFDDSVALVEDILFNIQYYTLHQGGINLLNNTGYYYRQHGSTTLSKKFDKRMFDWNEQGYTAVRDFLMANDAMTDKNRKHFYHNVLGNLIYSTSLMTMQDAIPTSDKLELLRKYTTSPLASEVFDNTTEEHGINKIQRMMLKDGCYRSYIIVNKLLTFLRKIKASIR